MSSVLLGFSFDIYYNVNAAQRGRLWTKTQLSLPAISCKDKTSKALMGKFAFGPGTPKIRVAVRYTGSVCNRTHQRWRSGTFYYRQSRFYSGAKATWKEQDSGRKFGDRAVHTHGKSLLRLLRRQYDGGRRHEPHGAKTLLIYLSQQTERLLLIWFSTTIST